MLLSFYIFWTLTKIYNFLLNTTKNTAMSNNNNYKKLSEEQLNQAYEYYLKKIIRLLDTINNTTILPTAEDRIIYIQTIREINKIRKIQGKKSIIISQDDVGSVSAYIKF